MKRIAFITLLALMTALHVNAVTGATESELRSFVSAPSDCNYDISYSDTYPWYVSGGHLCCPTNDYGLKTALDINIKSEGWWKVTVDMYNHRYTFALSSNYEYVAPTYYYNTSSSKSVTTHEGQISIYYDESYYFSSSNYITSITIARVNKEIPTVTYTEAGKLGSEILKLPGISELNDVKELKVCGPVNDFDEKVLSEIDNATLLDLTDAVFESETLSASLFRENDNIQCLLLPSNIKTIAREAFYDCDGLRYVYIPDLVTKIQTETFCGCQNLYEVGGCKNIEEIKNDAFYSCSSLKDINLQSAISIGNSAFNVCSNLKDINLKSAISIGNNAFKGCSSLKEVRLSSLEEIGNSAFQNCSALETLVLSDKLTSLGSQTFYGCTALKDITLPASITALNTSAFSECRYVTRVECNAPAPPAAVLSDSPFAMDVMLKATLVVQGGSKALYQGHSYWKYFGSWESSPTRVTDLTVASDIVIPATTRLDKLNMTIETSGSLSIYGNALQELKKVIMKADDAGYGRFLSECNAVTSDDTQIKYSMNAGKWYYISLPFDANVSELTVTDDAFFAICYYDGAERAANGAGASWKRITSGMLKAGVGYIVQCSKATTMTFTATDATVNNAFSFDAVSTPLSEYTSSRGTADQGWNFVGNPYMTYYDIYYMDYNAPITVWTGSSYLAYSIADDNLALKPMQPFFVQCPVGTSKITFNTQGRQLSSVIDHSGNNAQSMPIALANDATSVHQRRVYDITLAKADAETESDRTRIVQNAERSDDYEMSCDASKMMSDLETIPQIWTSNGGVDYAINEGKHTGGKVELHMYIPENGSYTLKTTRADGSVMLHDTLLKTSVDLTETDYDFQAVEGELDNRFFIMIGSNVPTAVNGLVEDGTDANGSSAEVFTIDGANTKNARGIVIKNGKKVLIPNK